MVCAEPRVSAPGAGHAARAPQQPADGEHNSKMEKGKCWRGLQPAGLLLGREVGLLPLVHGHEK